MVTPGSRVKAQDAREGIYTQRQRAEGKEKAA
jgi:hypothetical protein